jgi:hypothetical protein
VIGDAHAGGECSSSVGLRLPDAEELSWRQQELVGNDTNCRGQGGMVKRRQLGLQRSFNVRVELNFSSSRHNTARRDLQYWAQLFAL